MYIIYFYIDLPDFRYKVDGRSIREDPFKTDHKWTIISTVDHASHFMAIAKHVETVPHTCHINTKDHLDLEILRWTDQSTVERKSVVHLTR